MSKKKKTSSIKESTFPKEEGNVIDIAPFLSRRAVDGALSGSYGEVDETALYDAQELIYRAWETAGRRQRVMLARKALEISPDCADAYVLLAEESAASLDEATALYRKGVEAGQRVLGKRAFTDDVGYFWVILEARPYMRAREGLAQCLWDKGQHDEAILHYKDMLRLNPDDNQGIRYVFMSCLLELNRYDELWDLLNDYNDDDTYWLYTKALVSFRREGDSDVSTAALAEAGEANSHVPSYLLGTKKISKRLPEYVGIGNESEALVYAAANIKKWKKTPGALDWLAARKQSG
jgi:tetratricopeptide (TPR) repeat protein